ncbi:coiled-coil domain-containing protein 152 [Diretmus argenteus]
METFSSLEQKVTEMNGKNNMLEVMLDDANRVRDAPLDCVAERDGMLVTVNTLQQTLREQCNLRVENEKLKNDVADLRRQNERIAEDRRVEVQRLSTEIRAEEERHKRELETVKQQCRSEVEDACMEAFIQSEAKDAEMKRLLERNDLNLEEMKKRLRDQEKERQSELLKLQMEFGAKLARVQSTAQRGQQQQQQQQSSSLPHIFRRKLQVFQEEKNKEIGALRQRIKELEELPKQRASGLADSRLKKKN